MTHLKRVTCLCLNSINMYRRIPRLHLGLKLFAIKLLDPSHIERIRRKCKIDSGLIVQEVCMLIILFISGLVAYYVVIVAN